MGRGFLLLSPFLFFSAARAFAAELQVSAAVSLTDVLKEVAPLYERDFGDTLRFNFGSSSMLARQIQEAAPVDVFFSADEAKMDFLEREGFLVRGTRTSLLSNTLVVVVAADSPGTLAHARELADDRVKWVALAETKTVPAGIYAKDYLERIGVWAKIAPKVIPTENVRAVLAAVEAGNVDAGIVYKTDALISKKVRVACEVPRTEGPDISYPVAVVRASAHETAAKRFLAFLRSSVARAAFLRHGFLARENP